MTGSSAVTTNSRAASLRSRGVIRARRPAGGNSPVTSADQVAPGRSALERVVDRRAQVVDLAAPQGQALGALVGLQPYAAHLRFDLAVAVGAHPAAGAVAHPLWPRTRC